MKNLWSLFLKYWNKYREQITYLIFGVVTTLVNYIVYYFLTRWNMATGLANGIAWVVSVMVAYFTNRRWVFESKSTGKAMVREILSFAACRIGTFVLDEILVIVGVDWLGPRIIPAKHQRLWELGVVKVFSNVLVIVLNYVFSKIFIFKKSDKQ